MSDDNELAELLWENGQAVVHGLIDPPQPAFRPFSTGSSAVQEKHSGGDSNNMMAFTKAGSIFGGMGMAPSLHDYASCLHASHDNVDVDTVPWIHYPITEDDDNTAPADYCTDFFSELQEAAATADLGSLPPSPNHHATNSSRGPVASSSRAPSEEIHSLSAPTIQTSQTQSQVEFAAAKQRQPSGSGEGVMNFSFFTRLAALARATLQSGHVFANQRAVWPQPKEVRFTSAAAPAVTVGNLQQGMAREKAMVATSSVCSSNNEPWHQHQHQQKRKVHSERSASQDEDADDEFDALLRSASRSMKRSRNIEAHNLSERRRRDRINEKLHALQELIPNCNKIDKASILDEAIEYLKTLQLQVQMMSMGTGLCIPPVLLPPAMQHLQKNSMAHFPHLGMGLGYGMGVFDMNITGSIPISPLPGVDFPCQMTPGVSPQGIGIPGVNAMPMFGLPGQANPLPGSSVPPFKTLACLPGRQNPAPQVSVATARNSESTTTKSEV